MTRPSPPVADDEAQFTTAMFEAGRDYIRSVGGSLSAIDLFALYGAMNRISPAASDREVLVAENERLREALRAAREKLIDEDRSVGFIDAALIPLAGGVTR